LQWLLSPRLAQYLTSTMAIPHWSVHRKTKSDSGCYVSAPDVEEDPTSSIRVDLDAGKEAISRANVSCLPPPFRDTESPLDSTVDKGKSHLQTASRSNNVGALTLSLLASPLLHMYSPVKSLTPLSPPPTTVENVASNVPTEIFHVPRKMDITKENDPEFPAELSTILQSPDLELGRNIGSSEVHELDSDLEKIRLLRLDISGLRSKVHQMRSLLREKQDAKSVADDRLVSLLQRVVIRDAKRDTQEGLGSAWEEDVFKLMQESRDARGEYGPIEDDCNQLEDRLSEQEFRLTRLEERFFARLKQHLPSIRERAADVTTHSPSPTLSFSLAEDEDNQEHPLVTKYLSSLGDLDLLQEQLSDIEETKQFREEESETRERVGLRLAPEDQTWLEQSQELINGLLEKIRAATITVENLKQECLSRGLVDEDGEPTDFQSMEEHTFREDEDIDPKGQVSEYLKYPVLLPQPRSKTPTVYARRIKPDEKADNSALYINEWMLDKLQSSALEVVLLASTFEGTGGKIKEYWQNAVLSLWFSDGTTKPKTSLRPLASSASAHIQLGSERSADLSR
jgi:hypothetical protein